MLNSTPAAAGAHMYMGGGILARTGALRGVGVAPSHTVSRFDQSLGEGGGVKISALLNSSLLRKCKILRAAMCKGSFTLTEAEQPFNERNLNTFLGV